jgi:phosphopantetheinyl transferase (holo-ACP synthase)
MAIVGLGTDIIEIARIEQSLARLDHQDLSSRS